MLFRSEGESEGWMEGARERARDGLRERGMDLWRENLPVFHFPPTECLRRGEIKNEWSGQ